MKTGTASKFYAVADINGPISVRVIAENAREACDWFLSQDANFGDNCQTDAEDDLDFCGDGMSGSEFAETMAGKGYAVANSDMCGDHNWTLWSRA